MDPWTGQDGAKEALSKAIFYEPRRPNGEAGGQMGAPKPSRLRSLRKMHPYEAMRPIRETKGRMGDTSPPDSAHYATTTHLSAQKPIYHQNLVYQPKKYRPSL